MKIVPAHDPHAEAAAGPLRVLVAVREGLLRASLGFLLERQDGIVVTAEAGTGPEAVAAALGARPDVVVMDAALPALDGLEATRRILAACEPRATAVLLLLDDDDQWPLFAALRAGATGLLVRDADSRALVEAVRGVSAGETVLAPPVASRLVEELMLRPDRLQASPAQIEELTPREREVVVLVACGLSNEEIAERLVVTHATVKTHVSRALYKLHARDRAQLVVLAYECGLVRPGSMRQTTGDAVVVGLRLATEIEDRSAGR